MGASRAKTGITQKQRRLLRAAISRLGLNEFYYEILSSKGGAASSKALTQEGFRAIMAHLEDLGFELAEAGYPRYVQKWQGLGQRPGMATVKELAMIEYLWDQVEFYWNKDGEGNPPSPSLRRIRALQGFLHKRFCVDHLRFLDAKQAHGMIEALKAIKAR